MRKFKKGLITTIGLKEMIKVNLNEMKKEIKLKKTFQNTQMNILLLSMM